MITTTQLIIIFIFIIIILVIVKLKVALITKALFTSLVIFFMVALLVMNQYKNVPTFYDAISIEAPHDLYSLALGYDENNNGYLYDNASNIKLSYQSLGKKVNSTFYKPIYIKSINSNYYISVFSSENESLRVENHFTFDDYETRAMNGKASDKLVIISKETGNMATINAYELIGYTLSLDDLVSSSSIISIPVYKKYEIDYDKYFTIFLNDTPDSLDTLKSITYPNSLGLSVTNFAITNSMILVSYNDGSILLQNLQYNFDYENGYFSGGRIQLRHCNILDDELYVKDGYFAIINDQIYFLSKDFRINKLISCTDYLYVSTASGFENWTSYIPID